MTVTTLESSALDTDRTHWSAVSEVPSSRNSSGVSSAWELLPPLPATPPAAAPLSPPTFGDEPQNNANLDDQPQGDVDMDVAADVQLSPPHFGPDVLSYVEVPPDQSHHTYHSWREEQAKNITEVDEPVPREVDIPTGSQPTATASSASSGASTLPRKNRWQRAANLKTQVDKISECEPRNNEGTDASINVTPAQSSVEAISASPGAMDLNTDAAQQSANAEAPSASPGAGGLSTSAQSSGASADAQQPIQQPGTPSILENFFPLEQAKNQHRTTNVTVTAPRVDYTALFYSAETDDERCRNSQS